MALTTPEQVRTAIQREFDMIREDDPQLPQEEINTMVNVVLQTPEDVRETYVTNFVRETLERRRGDPRS